MSEAPGATYADLNGKTVFVSGGATGIGACIVEAFCRQGARVLFVDINEAAGRDLATRLGDETGAAPEFRLCDVTDTAALHGAIDAAHGLAGRLDALVNNAAHDKRHDLEEVTPEFWEWCVNVNIRHQYFAAQRAFHWMKPARSGSIINFGSVAPRMGIPELTIYGAMKSGVRGMTRTMARAMGGANVRVNAIVPGAILTPRQLELWISPEDEARIRKEQCLDRRLVGEDIAPSVLFLASDVSSAITSQDIVVDGGLTS